MLFSNTPVEWLETTLGEICSRAGGSIQTGPFGSQLHASDYVKEGIPSIMPANISNGRVREDGIARITKSDAKRLSKYLVQDGDIVYSRRGDVEKCALITKAERGWLCGTGCLRVRLGKGVVDPQFASYFLAHPESKAWISRHAVGATMPNLNTGILSQVPFLLPPSMEQKAIAHILGTLDEKIELNQKMNQTLEEIAKAIFKSWFVDFDPVRAKAEGHPTGLPPEISDLFPDELVASEIGEIPKGWELKTIQDVAKVTSGKRPPEKESVQSERCQYVVYGGAGPMAFCSEPLNVTKPAIITGRVGTLGKVFYLTDECWVSDNSILICNAGIHSPLILYTLQSVDLTVLNVGSTQPLVTGKDIKNLNVIAPPNHLLELYGSFFDLIKGRQSNAAREIRVLSELRDTLLPKLISGELRIPDAEKFLEEVGI